jgi:CRISPR-associated protein Cas5t
LLNRPELSVVLRTVWRVKSLPLGTGGNLRPDFQQLLSPIELVMWLDSSEEIDDGERLESRVLRALDQPKTIERFGGLSLGESTHLVDQVRRFPRPDRNPKDAQQEGQTFLLVQNGQLTLPIWVDHVGSTGTRHATGTLQRGTVAAPSLDRMPRIMP